MRWSAVIIGLAMFLGGCGGAGSALEEKKFPPPAVMYYGLKGQLCGVMVWADWGTRTEYNQIQLDLARSIQYRLEERIPSGDKEKKDEDKDKDLVGTKFVDSRSVMRFQREHPEIDGSPIAEVAPKLGVDRVIYVELEKFEAQSPETIMLLKGRTIATLRVVEVANGVAKVALEERGIGAAYPPDAPEGVVASDRMTVTAVYKGTVEALADRIVARFGVEQKK